MLAVPATAELPVPPLRGRVNDLADLLPPDRESALEARLAAFEGESTHQIAVLTVPTTGGEPIADYALRVADTWKLGQKGLDNGMLLVIAKQDREAWVTVGYGLEGAVPDVVANRVIEDVMIPRFRDGDFAGGISAACEGLIRAARGEEIPAARRPAPAFRTRPNADPMMALIFSMMAASFVSLPFRRRARPLGALLGGGAAAAVMWLLLASALFAGLGFVLGAFLSAMGPMQMGGPRRGRWGGGGFGGGFGGGGFGGGGGGGFGGGGGRFGGGGAGGRW